MKYIFKLLFFLFISMGGFAMQNPTDSINVSVNFTPSATTIAIGDTVAFDDITTVGLGVTITGRRWHFIGGSPDTSTLKNPKIKYNATGMYAVSLVVFTSQGADSVIKMNHITVIVPSEHYPKAHFVADKCNGLPGLNVNFTDQSFGDPFKWEWTFEGGTPATDTVKNPVGIQYNTAGNYKVSLVITNTFGKDTLIKNNYIHIVMGATAPPIAEFYANPHFVLVGQEVNFADSSKNFPIEWQWSFPNGTPTSSNVQNPIGIKYDSVGLYTVTLTCINGLGSSIKTKTEYIYVTTDILTAACDTISNIDSLEGSLIDITPVSGGGWVAGSNFKNVKAYADKFTNYSYSEVSSIIFTLGKKQKFSNKSVKFCVWANGANAPGELLGSVIKPISIFHENISEQISFFPPVKIDGIFYIGFETVTDTFVLNIVNRGVNGLNTMYVKNSAGNWQTSKAIFNFGASLDILPTMCLVDVPKLEKENCSFLIFPNPANNEITIDFGDISYTNANISVSDLQGRKLIANQIEGLHPTIQLDTKILVNGIYFLNIRFNNKNYIRKFAICR